MCCSVCCSLLQCVAVCEQYIQQCQLVRRRGIWLFKAQRAAVCVAVCVAVYYSLLQCVDNTFSSVSWWGGGGCGHLRVSGPMYA